MIIMILDSDIESAGMVAESFLYLIVAIITLLLLFFF